MPLSFLLDLGISLVLVGIILLVLSRHRPHK